MVTNENVLKQKDMDELLLFLGTSKRIKQICHILSLGPGHKYT